MENKYTDPNMPLNSMMSNEPFRKKALRGDSEKMLIPKSRLLNCE
jgi:hypothetical protein